MPSFDDDKKVKELILDSINIDAQSIINFVSNLFAPDEVFDRETLIEWAEDNDFIRID